MLDSLAVTQQDRSRHEYAGRKERSVGYYFATEKYHQLHVIYVLEGFLGFKSPLRTVTAGAGDVVVMRDGSSFELSCQNQGYQGVFYISDDRPSERRKGGASVFAAGPEMRVVAELMDRQAKQPGHHSHELIVCLGRTAALLALETVTRLEDGSRGTGVDAAFHARIAIESGIYSSQSCQQILSGIPMSYRQLSRHFVRTFGQSPSRYRRKCRIREASRLLAGSPLSITEIATELGFSSSQHLCAVFRAEMRTTPSEYRISCR